jgi:hypothetical protein
MYKIIGADQKQYGPVTEAELRQWIAQGRVGPQTLIQVEGQPDWRPLSSFPEFATAPQPAPSGVPLPSSPYPSVDARQKVNGPGIALMVVGIISILVALAGAANNIVQMVSGNVGELPPEIPPQMRQIIRSTSGPVGLVMNFLGIALGGFSIFASMKMRKLENFGLVMAATILSMIPCTSGCCCVGLPVGIWILIVLLKPEVKSAFH